MNLLLIEDDANLRAVLTELLVEEGFEVSAVANGTAALSTAEQLDFQILLTDVRLPGEDGIEILGQLRNMGKRFRSVVITGYSDRDAAPRAIQRGTSDFLYKPFELDELIQTLQRAAQEESELARVEGDYLKLLEQAIASQGNQFHRVPQASLLSQRACAFKAFYVAVRARKLDPYESRFIYSLLEDLEKELVVWASGKGLPELERGYQRVVEDVSAVSEQGGLLFVVPELPEAIPFDSYQPLHERIWRGRVEGYCSLLLAPLLRSYPELNHRHRDQIWGD